MAHRSNARLLAPIALVGSLLAVAIITGSSLGGDDSATKPTDAEQRVGSGNAKKTRTTVVKSGDTPSAIAEREGISMERLLELNPRIADPRTLHAGDRLKLGP